MATPERPDEWWREAVIYQIYPRSFQDSTGNGVGDLAGIISRLDYLNDGTERSLGIDAIWLSPTFPSPMKDFGYDVADYTDVHPDFGTLETMDRLIEACHSRGIRVLLDWVPNHTSDQHPWFVESRSSRHNPRRDWYVWRDARPDGSLPNNWPAAFGGPAWTLDETTGQYYLHSFLPEQPDLNWRNPEVVEAMHDTLRFWFRRGIDGFRIDVMGMIVKHPDLADNPTNPDWHPGSRLPRLLPANNRNYPDVFDAVRGIRSVFDEFPEKMAVGEVFGTAEEVARFYGDHRLDGLHLAFNFQFISEEANGHTPWDAAILRRIVTNAELALPPGAQPCFALNNHDRSRFISRNNDDGHGPERARAAALLVLGVRGTPFLYYGEEIGMVDVDIPEDQRQDPARHRSIGRDPERTPMQWDASPGRGFFSGRPWLPYGPVEINVAAQEDAPDSMLSLYRRAIWRRKSSPALRHGGHRELLAPGGVFAFVREAAGSPGVVVALNTTLDSPVLELPPGYGRVVVASHVEHEGRTVEGRLTLPPLGAAWVERLHA